MLKCQRAVCAIMPPGVRLIRSVRSRATPQCFLNAFSTPEKSLAFIGNASKPKTIALPKSAFSITRLEGSRWRLRRTRWVMEKVGECGLMLFRDEGFEDLRIVGDDEWRTTTFHFSTLMALFWTAVGSKW